MDYRAVWTGTCTSQRGEGMRHRASITLLRNVTKSIFIYSNHKVLWRLANWAEMGGALNTRNGNEKWAKNLSNCWIEEIIVSLRYGWRIILKYVLTNKVGCWYLYPTGSGQCTLVVSWICWRIYGFHNRQIMFWQAAFCVSLCISRSWLSHI